MPHHHHQNKECAVLEWCLQDEAYNDRHTHHKAEGQERHHSFCMQDYMLFVKAHSQQNLVRLLLALLFIPIFVFGRCIVRCPFIVLFDNLFTGAYFPLPRVVTSVCGLRAPPSHL